MRSGERPITIPRSVPPDQADAWRERIRAFRRDLDRIDVESEPRSEALR